MALFHYFNIAVMLYREVSGNYHLKHKQVGIFIFQITESWLWVVNLCVGCFLLVYWADISIQFHPMLERCPDPKAAKQRQTTAPLPQSSAVGVFF